jgi:GATA zinc finger
MKKPEDESNAEGEDVELLMRRSSTGMLHPRICANCRTSKTPLWRSGPTGPKVSSIQFSIFLFRCVLVLLYIQIWIVRFPLVFTR